MLHFFLYKSLRAMMYSSRGIVSSLFFVMAMHLGWSDQVWSDDLLLLENGKLKIGIDREKGGSITWLSWNEYPKNMVNLSDPGRLIQQSYYAGKSLDRKKDGQSKAWSPWTWNPIQGGGVSSWARVREFKRLNDRTLYAETIPKLWDMPNEEASAIMRQWTSIEPSVTNGVEVRCEFVSDREDSDLWGPAIPRAQEIPACYFSRVFSEAKSYLGDSQWRDESHPPGPPWGHAQPPRNSMAFFTASGQGVAIFSPSSTQPWNFGPHGNGLSDDPLAGPCMHVAPLDRISLGPRSTYRFRYWIVVGNQVEIESSLDSLWEKYSFDRAELK